VKSYFKNIARKLIANDVAKRVVLNKIIILHILQFVVEVFPGASE
jgi:hypothetical protein